MDRVQVYEEGSKAGVSAKSTKISFDSGFAYAAFGRNDRCDFHF
ncbi:hypothetical protein C4K37_5019 [Pseudomonas chlororaphis subsp. piscium]|nr:hypothetical protein C4K37_5019 [Pseudomonas chlororaphis subsp. piscium]